MEPHIERIMRDMKEMLEELYVHAYEEGKADQEIEDIEKIDSAYARGADEGYAEGERNGYRQGKNEVEN